MCGWNIMCGISKGTFEIPHKTSYPYIENDFYSVFGSQIYELVDVFETPVGHINVETTLLHFT